VANTTWNPADLVSITLSGGNLIATGSASSAGVRGKDAQSSGQYYWEYTYTTINTNSVATGVALATANLATASTGTSTLARTTGGISVNGSATGSALGIINAGNVIGIAVDFTAKLIWYRVAPSGNWNGSGTANPGTGAGGLSISAISTGPLYPYMASGTSDKITANFGDGAFTGAVPSGFTAGFPVPLNYVDFAGNLGGVSSYGMGAYGAKLYSRVAAFEPAFAGDANVVRGFSGDLAPAISFDGDLNVFGFRDFSGDLAPQIDLGGSLNVDLSLTALEGGLTPIVDLAASSFISGPLWTASPCPAPPWTESEPCPPSLWTPTDPCDEVEWDASELCRG
jgi:hypothetical protein